MFCTCILASHFNKEHLDSIPIDNVQPQTVRKHGRVATTIIGLVFLLELVLFIWALVLAVRCGKKHEDLALHLIVAFFFPIIYIIYYYLVACGAAGQ